MGSTTVPKIRTYRIGGNSSLPAKHGKRYKARGLGNLCQLMAGEVIVALRRC
jgi:hypothetical protein